VVVSILPIPRYFAAIGDLGPGPALISSAKFQVQLQGSGQISPKKSQS
jgi:hypothetical protein